jgi:hypothetical protein
MHLTKAGMKCWFPGAGKSDIIRIPTFVQVCMISRITSSIGTHSLRKTVFCAVWHNWQKIESRSHVLKVIKSIPKAGETQPCQCGIAIFI